MNSPNAFLTVKNLTDIFSNFWHVDVSRQVTNFFDVLILEFKIGSTTFFTTFLGKQPIALLFIDELWCLPYAGRQRNFECLLFLKELFHRKILWLCDYGDMHTLGCYINL